MARNSENAPSEPSGRRRKPPEEGGSSLRQHFRDSIRDALSGVDVDELHGRSSLRVPSDVSLLTREAVTGLEEELAKLRAERAELEHRAVEAPVAAPAPAPRWPWRRGKGVVAVEEAEDGSPASAVAWSVAAAMEPIVEGRHRSAPVEVVEEIPAEISTAPEPTSAEAATLDPAPDSGVTAPKPRRRPRNATLTDAELESVVAPLLAELSNLRAEVRELRGDPEVVATRTTNAQLVKLVAGVLVGFALIVVALAVVLKA
jgi:hypothetical protein